MARVLTEGRAAVLRQDAAERQMAATVAGLAQHERAWKLRLGVVVVVLFVVSSLVAVIGFATRETSEAWHFYFAFGSVASVSTVVLGLAAAAIVPSMVRRVVGHWSAIRRPGEAGLGCRVCGGPLPVIVAPVLRCDYCFADNLAGSARMQEVSSATRHAEESVLAVSMRKARGDQLAASALRAFPWLVALAWFAVYAAFGLVSEVARDVEIWPSESERFSLIRLGPSLVCLAATSIDGDRVELYLSSTRRHTMTRAELARYSVAEPIPAPALVGRHTDRGRITSVYRSLNRLGTHRGRVEDGSEVYLPDALGAGELVCMNDVPAGAGAVLP